MRLWGPRVLRRIFCVNGKLYFFLASLLTQSHRCILNKTECVKAGGHGHACQVCMRAKQRCEGGTFGSGVKLAESMGSTRGLQVVKVLGDIVEVLSDIRDSLDDWQHEVEGCLDELEWSEEDEVTATRWDEEQEQLTAEKVMWEEFLKWKEEKSKKVEVGVGTGEEIGLGSGRVLEKSI